jgi:hypothetical protein
MDTVMIRSGKVVSLLGAPITNTQGGITGYNGVTTATTGNAHYKDSPYSTFQATVTGTGAVTATVVIDCSNDGSNWCATALGTISLSGTTSSSDGFTTTAPWKYIRARVTAISGTGATVVSLMGV